MTKHNAKFGLNESKAIISINLADQEVECALIDIFSIDDIKYAALIGFETNELYIFELKEDDLDKDNILLEFIEDEDQMNLVYDQFEDYWSDEMIDEVMDSYYDELEDEE
ncbi:MAG: DUF1292 domain-containing protein [Tissierellia bacterium]|nr:DUF1292 domain-containing protein [Tissierellia bacterium]